MPFVEPHSPKWFSIVDRADRAFARTVRATIGGEQSRDICTLCGFPPLGDFQIVEAVTIRRAIPSLRLCECCLVDRQVAGETLVPQGGVLERGGHPDHRGFLGFWKRVYRRLG
jgi:hypothetical protein